MNDKLTKTLQVGEKVVLLATNRKLMIEIFKKFPEFSKSIFSVSKAAKEPNGIESEEAAKRFGENWIELLELNDMMPEIAHHVFVKMALLADSTVSDEFLKRVLDDVESGNGEDVFAKIIIEFLLSGFNQDKPTPTVGIALS